MMKDLQSWLCSGNVQFVEDLYEQYLCSADSVAPQWREYFDSLQHDQGGVDVAQAYREPTGSSLAQSDEVILHGKQAAVLRLISNYRSRGHGQADLDPLAQHKRLKIPELAPEYYNLGPEDLDKPFNTGSLVAQGEIPLRQIIDMVDATYCKTIGAEYMYINDHNQRHWIQERLETTRGAANFSHDKKKRVLDRIIAANVLEEYLHTSM